jgi:uncharacterized RDD family membrane protein YckC
MLRLTSRRSVTVNASILKRVLAFIIDLLIVDIAIVFPFQGVLRRIVPAGGFIETYRYFSVQGSSFLLYAIATTVTVLALMYFVLLEKKMGQSVGKIFFRLYVVGTDKEELSTWRCLLRSIFLIPLFPFILLWIVDPVFVGFSHEHQRLTEYLSRTKVVEHVYW